MEYLHTSLKIFLQICSIKLKIINYVTVCKIRFFSEFKKPSKFRAVQIYSFRGIGNLNFIFSPVLKTDSMKPKYKSDKSILLSVFT